MKDCNKIFPLENVLIRKVKVLKKPKFDVTALMEWHNDDSGADTGTAVKPETENLVAGSGGRL